MQNSKSVMKSRGPRLPARYAGVVTPLLLSVLMTCVVSAVSTLLNIGPNLDALNAWPRAWMVSWVIAFPVLLVMLPLVRRIAGRIIEPA